MSVSVEVTETAIEVEVGNPDLIVFNNGVEVARNLRGINFVNATSIVTSDQGVTVTLPVGGGGGGGEANTAQNLGSGIGVFDAKVGIDLQFRSIVSQNNRLTVALDAGNDEIDLTVVESNIVHQNLSGAGTNTHAQIDAHIGAGGTTHPVAVAGGNAGFLSGADKTKLDGIATGAQVNAVDSVFGRTGAVVAAQGDFTAAQITFASDGDIASTTVQTAVVEVRDDTDTKLAAKVEVGGQLGGTVSSPDVRGLRETSGPTLLTLGAIADGEVLVRSGSTIISQAAGGGGGSGDVVGPASATDNAVVVFNGTTGKVVQEPNAPVSFGGQNITTVGTVDGRDIATDGTKLDGIAAGAQVNVVTSVLGRTGAVVAAASDYDADQVDFTPDGDLTSTNVQTALVELRDDSDTKLAAKADLAGQLGGTAASPDIRGIRETSGPTLLSFGAIADGEVLVRSGSTIVSQSVGGGGGETNTASNLGAGIGVFDAKVGVDLQFRSLVSQNNRLSITLDAISDEVDLTVNEGNIVHQNLSGAGTNTHAQIDTHIADTANPHGTDIANLGAGTLAELNANVSDATLLANTRSLTAGTGLTGGGDLSADRTFNVAANADGSIVVNANDVQVGVLATDVQHGNRGGGALHANVVAAGAAGFMSGADKTKLDGIATGADVSPVATVFGRSGAVVAAASDYDANQVDFTANGDIAATDVQAAIVEVRDDTDTKLAAKLDSTGATFVTALDPELPSGATSTIPDKVGTNHAQEFVTGANTECYFRSFIPPEYQGGSIRVHLRGSTDGTDADDVDLDIAIARQNAGTAMGSNSFATAVASAFTPTTTADVVDTDTTDLLSSQLDGAVAGDMILIRIRRNGTTESPVNGDSFHLYGIYVTEV